MQATETLTRNGRCENWPPPAKEAEAKPANGPRVRHESSGPSRHARRWRMTAQLLELLRPFRRSALLLVALSLAAVAVDVVPPMLQGYLVDHVLKPDIATPRAQLLLLLGSIVTGLLLARLAATLVGACKGRLSSVVGTSMTANLRAQLVRKLNELPLSFYDRNQTGALMSQVAYDTETLHTVVHHATSGVLLQLLQLAGISAMLVYLNSRLALVALLPMPLIFAGSWYFTRYLQPRHHHYWEAVGKQAAALTGMLSGIRVVKSFVQEEREIRRFCESSRRLRDSRIAVDASTATFAAAMGFLFALGTLAAWYLGGHDVLLGGMTLGALMAFLQYLAMFYTPLTSIAESTTWFANFFSVSRRVCDLLDAPAETIGLEPLSAALPLQGHIELRNVSFGYDKNRPVLHDVTFAISPGEMVGVVGRSGSGKSTLVSLIGRLYDADRGQILIDGADVRELDRRRLRAHIGMVPQDPFLFRGTVVDNLAYGSSNAAAEQVLLAAKLADAHDFIMRMPLAYSTQLGEGGAGLSGGERQRLSIARALLFDPAILILDEATANVDAESEKAICRAIRDWTGRRRTAIVIAHRLSTLQEADRMLVFDQGRLIEEGSQRKLLANNGVYSTLLRLQCNLPAAAGASMHDEAAGNALRGVPNSERRGGHPLQSDDAGCGLARLDPDRVRIGEGRQGALCVTIDGTVIENVLAVRAMPSLFERQYISLQRRDASGRGCELGIIASLDDWPARESAAVARSLTHRYPMRHIREIRQIRTSGNQLAMAVATDDGPVAVRLEKPGEGSQPFGPNGLLLTNSDGSYYLIPDRGALPKRQQRLLTLYLGD